MIALLAEILNRFSRRVSARASDAWRDRADSGNGCVRLRGSAGCAPAAHSNRRRFAPRRNRASRATSDRRGNMMVVSIILLVAYSAFCCWAIFMGGAEALDKFIISGRSGKPFTPRKLKLYIGIVWLLALGLTLLQVFFGPWRS
jgi:hypothetical protein